MPPILRPRGGRAPNYGSSGDEFSLEIHHGGIFVVSGGVRSYVDGKVSWYDHCEVDTWSTLWFGDFLAELGYKKLAPVKVYWLLPEKELNDGLRFMSSDAESNTMCSLVEKVKNFIVYFDHESNGGVFEDMLNDVKSDKLELPDFYNDLPKVMSPAKAREEHQRRRVNEQQEKNGSGSDNDSEVSDFLDSDNEIDDGDDDIYADKVEDDNVASRIKKGKKAVGSRMKAAGVSMNIALSDDSTSEDELDLPEEEKEGQVRLKFSTFRNEYMSNPSFKVGMIFETVQKLREALDEYSMKNRVEIKIPRNDKRRLRAHCAAGYPWTSRWLADKYLDSFRSDDKMTLTNFSRTVQKEWNVTPSRSKLARARRMAMKKIYGDENEQYNRLWDYGEELRVSNPGSKFYMTLVDNHFSSCYMSLDACKRGFLLGCRPLICLDGSHIKTKFGGVILTAIGIDPNDCIYPIAIAVVEVETKASWKWFLQTLKSDLGIENTYPWTIMTDKQKGLIPAVQEVFPQSEHRFCVRHLWSNFKDAGFKGEILKNQLWTCARASTVAKWKYQMEKMKDLNADAFAWLDKMAPNTWVRAFFAEFPKSDILLNNNCEVFNSYILEARELPILSMLERIKQQLMTRYYTKQKEVLEFVGTICPKIRKKVAKFAEYANVCYVLPSGSGVFQVLDREFHYIVDITAKTCDYRKWNLTGIPCQHAISCLRHERIDPESVVHECYSIESFKKAYGTNIRPCKDMSTWEKVNGTKVLPPVYEKKVGRPPRCRRKQPYEKEGKHGPSLSKHGCIMTCSYCRGENHNSRGCPVKKMGVRPEDYIPDVVPIDDELPGLDQGQAVVNELYCSQHNTQGAPPSEQMTQDCEAPIYCNLMSQMTSTMLLQMMEQGGQTAISAVPPQPLPDSAFINSNIPLPRPAPLTTATKEGRNTTKKRQTAPKQAAATTKKKK